MLLGSKANPRTILQRTKKKIKKKFNSVDCCASPRCWSNIIKAQFDFEANNFQNFVKEKYLLQNDDSAKSMKYMNRSRSPCISDQSMKCRSTSPCN